jgi:DNA-binding LytR/AlgR family response regulator
MLKLLVRPLPSLALLPASVAIVFLVALYCFAYTRLDGQSETFAEGLVWAAVNVLPWFLAFELSKRSTGLVPRAALLGCALAVSLLLHLAAYGVPDAPLFELVRRLPALALVAGLLGLGAMPALRPKRRAELPLLPRQIDWIGAAGNYVELHGCGRTIIHRSPLAALEKDLAGHGFLRIHRSTLVRRAAVARVRSVDIVLRDGTHLKLGNRYRAAIDAALDFGPFVPAE